MLVLLVAASLQSAIPPVRTVGKGDTSAIDQPQHVVTRSATDWATLWRQHAGASQPPAVDFSREMVVGVFLGMRPTAGYGVEIVRVVGTDSVQTVEYVETAPRRGALTAQVLTAPYHLAAVPKHDGEIRFQVVEK